MRHELVWELVWMLTDTGCARTAINVVVKSKRLGLGIEVL